MKLFRSDARATWTWTVCFAFLFFAETVSAASIDTTLTVRVTSVDPGLTALSVGDAFTIDFTVDDSIVDVNPSAGAGSFPALLTSFSMTASAGNSGAWEPTGVFDLVASNFVTNAFGDNFTFQLRGTGFPDGGVGWSFGDVDLSFSWPLDLTDSGSGDLFSDQLLPGIFGVPPATLFPGVGIRFTDGDDYPTAFVEPVVLPEPIAFTGVFDTVSDPDGRLPPSIQLGTLFAVSFRLDPAEIGSGFDIGQGTLYNVPAPISDIEVAIDGGETVGSPLGSILVSNDRDLSGQGLGFETGDAWVTFPMSTAQGFEVGVIFFDETSTKLASETPFVNDTLTGWSSAQLRIVDRDLGLTLATGTLFLEPAPAVPTMPPVGLTLLTGGVVVLATRRLARGEKRRRGTVCPGKSSRAPSQPRGGGNRFDQAAEYYSQQS